jgi:hypothetical protein
MNVQSHAEGVVSVIRRPAVTPGTRYKFFHPADHEHVGRRAAAAGLVRRLRDAGLHLGRLRDLARLDLAGVLVRCRGSAGAIQVQLSVVSPAGQNFAYVLDSLQLNECLSPMTPDGCRLDARR